MLSMETAVQSPNSSMEADKPRAPRFEAYVMTGDAILNLSRTTHSPEYLPVHSKRRPAPQQQPQPSTSVPTSPVDQSPQPKPWEPDTPAKTPVSSTVRSFKSEESLNHHSQPETPSKTAEERTFSHNALTEVQENERIVWTYNAPMTGMSEKEMRRYLADQFWLNTRTENYLKQLKNSAQADEPPAEEAKLAHVHEEKQTCDTSNTPRTTELVADNAITNAEAAAQESVHESVQEPVPELPKEESTGPNESPLEESASSPARAALSRSPTDDDSDADSLQSVHFSPKGVDMPSAIRLAKR